MCDAIKTMDYLPLFMAVMCGLWCIRCAIRWNRWRVQHVAAAIMCIVYVVGQLHWMLTIDSGLTCAHKVAWNLIEGGYFGVLWILLRRPIHAGYV